MSLKTGVTEVCLNVCATVMWSSKGAVVSEAVLVADVIQFFTDGNHLFTITQTKGEMQTFKKSNINVLYC